VEAGHVKQLHALPARLGDLNKPSMVLENSPDVSRDPGQKSQEHMADTVTILGFDIRKI